MLKGIPELLNEFFRCNIVFIIEEALKMKDISREVQYSPCMANLI